MGTSAPSFLSRNCRLNRFVELIPGCAATLTMPTPAAVARRCNSCENNSAACLLLEYTGKAEYGCGSMSCDSVIEEVNIPRRAARLDSTHLQFEALTPSMANWECRSEVAPPCRWSWPVTLLMSLNRGLLAARPGMIRWPCFLMIRVVLSPCLVVSVDR